MVVPPVATLTTQMIIAKVAQTAKTPVPNSIIEGQLGALLGETKPPKPNTGRVGLPAIFSNAHNIHFDQLFPEPFCIASTQDHAFESIKNFAAYPNLPGAESKCAGIKAAKMIKSEPHELFTNTPYGLQVSEISTLIQPMPSQLKPNNEDDRAVFPEFTLICSTLPIKRGEQRLYQVRCDLNPNAPTYAVTQFHTIITIFPKNSKNCGANEIAITVEGFLDFDSDQVQAIYDASTPLGSIGGYIGSAVCDPNDFFENYFQNFYSGWVTSL